MRANFIGMSTAANHANPTTEIDWKARALAAEAAVAEHAARVEYLEAQLRLHRAKRFGSSSEKTAPGQLRLFDGIFNEAEATAEPFSPEPDLSVVNTPKRKRRKRLREELFEGLPERVIEHRLSPEELACSCCGHERHVVREERSKELRVIPAQFSVDIHVQYVYGCRHCEHHGDGDTSPITLAPRPKRPYPKSVASPSAIAFTMDQKYTMGIPLYRQEQQWHRSGVQISRQTLSNWVVDNANWWLAPLWQRMKETLLQQDIILADETTVRVLHEDGKTTPSKAYMWLYRSGRDAPGLVLLEYQPSRQGAHPRNFLEGFRGYLQTDAYSGYNQVEHVTRIGCWSHARRGFTEAIQAAGGAAKAPRAREGKVYCDRLFQLEAGWATLSFPERYQQRLIHSTPVLEAFLGWLHETEAQSMPKTYLGKAVFYCLHQWQYLNNFLLDGRLDIDNNASERSIKPYVISRKNFLFCQTPKGAKASAITFSLIESAKANGLKPFDYLEHIFQHMPNATTSQLDDFLPWSRSIPAHCRNSH